MGNANNLSINLQVLGFPTYAQNLHQAQILAVNTTVNINNSFNSLSQSSDRLTNSLKLILFRTVTAGAIAAVRAILDYSSNLEQARVGLTTMTGSESPPTSI